MSFLTGTQAELLYCMPATGLSVTGTVSTGGTAQMLTPLLGATQQPFLLPAYFFPSFGGRGTSILIQGGGTILSGPANENVRFILSLDTTVGTIGGAGSGTILCTTGAFNPLGTTVNGTGAFMFEAIVTCTNTGTAGTLNTIGRLFTGTAGNPTTTQATNASPTLLMQSATQPVFNNATAYFIELYAYFAATTTTQAVTLTNFMVWGLN